MNLAVMDSAMASLLMVRAYNEKEMGSVNQGLFNIEQAHLIRPEARWGRSSEQYKEGLELLRRRNVMRYCIFHSLFIIN